MQKSKSFPNDKWKYLRQIMRPDFWFLVTVKNTGVPKTKKLDIVLCMGFSFVL